jgi:hypothetical protein
MTLAKSFSPACRVTHWTTFGQKMNQKPQVSAAAPRDELRLAAPSFSARIIAFINRRRDAQAVINIRRAYLRYTARRLVAGDRAARCEGGVA